MYKNNIGLDDRYKFGVEIEFENVYLDDLYLKLLDSNLPVTYELCHKLKSPDYSTWYLDYDVTVSEGISNKIIGGELSSRILSDNKNDWLELKNICDVLNNMKAIATDKCSVHITVDVSKYLDNSKFFEVLSKILTIYEDYITLFYMGERYLIRNTKNTYALNMKSRLENTILDVDFSSEDFLDNLFSTTYCFNRYDAVSFHKLNEKGLIEIRYPNGSINPEIIQNYINFTLKLLDSIIYNEFNLDYLNLLIEEGSNNDISFLDIIDIISYSRDEKNEFYNQYMNVLNTKDDDYLLYKRKSRKV